MILIIGKSDLAKTLSTTINAEVVGRPEYDFSKQQDCDLLVNNYSPSVIINTLGILSEDYWEILAVNYVSVAYLTLKFYEKLDTAHIINISSASVYWPSYPDIPSNRLCYNLSKEALSSFGKHFNRKIIDDTNKEIIISTFEPGKFNSKMNNYSGGMDIDYIADKIIHIIDKPVTSMSVIK